MRVKTSHWPMMLTVVCTCGLMSALSLAASLTPYANDFASKDRKAGSQRCYEVTRQAPVEDSVFLNHKQVHDFLLHTLLYTKHCVESYDPGSKVNQPESVTMLLLHAAVPQPLSGLGCGPGLDCRVQGLGDLESLSGESLLFLSPGAAPVEDEQRTALWSPSGGETIVALGAGDNATSLLEKDHLVLVRPSATALPYTPAPTLWDRILHFGPLLLLLLQRLRGRF